MPKGVYPRGQEICRCRTCSACLARSRANRSYWKHRVTSDNKQLQFQFGAKVTFEPGQPLPIGMEKAITDFFHHGVTAKQVAMDLGVGYTDVKIIYKRLEAEEDEKFNGTSKDNRGSKINAGRVGGGSGGQQLRHDSRESGQGNAGALHPEGD